MAANGQLYESLGGPACYSGITSRRFKFDVSLLTRIGKDFPAEMHKTLRDNNLVVSDGQIVDAPTTRFRLALQGNTRT